MKYPSELPPRAYVDRRYKVVKTLGQGGFGRTYLVEDERQFKKCCVLKEFVPQVQQKHAIVKSRELFEREAKVLNQLEHPQIPKFYGWFEENNRLFLVQQFIDGKTYAELLYTRKQQGKAFSQEEVTQLLKNILPVLQYIHTNNIIHRDISPDNIMLCNEAEKPILIDFGVVNQQTATKVASGAVSAGTTVGKQSYSPIEQISRGICFESSDLYALGVTAMVLLTGKQPQDFYDGQNNCFQWRRYTQVSDKLAKIIDTMTAEAHRNRYQSAQEVLEQFVAPFPTYIPHRIPKLKSNFNKNYWIFGGLVAAALVGGSFFFLSRNMEGICKTLNNCSPNIEYKAEYEEIVQQAESVITEAANNDNLNSYNWQQLQQLKNKLTAVTRELETIPVTAKIYNEVEQTLKQVTTQVERVEKAMTLDLPDNMYVNPKVSN
ncbi:MAG: protein kinase [Pleurocapsa sp.]